MKHIVIGTAGHIDHGKTTLIKRLTGIETDTTREEKERGMSINLGFAYVDLPNGERIGIVDVPGHEKFIKNMLAGVAGINLVLLVIDANEGIMPQTKEHMDILTLLGIEDFIVVLTKVGAVDEELREIVYEDIQESLKGTPLEQAPIIETDAVENIGIDKLKEVIMLKVEQLSTDLVEAAPRLNVDRSFSVKGFGTVVTGTLLDGSLKIGDELIAYPGEIKTKVRNIQVHETNQDLAYPGQRTALNLTKIGVDEVGRGSVLTTKANVEPTWMLDTKITCLNLPQNQLELWDRVHLHIGTKEVRGRIVPLGVDKILAGEEGFVQLRLEEQVAVKSGDHFIIRSYSPVVTIGGGVVLEANPVKHRRFNEETLASLKIKEEGNFEDLILDYLNNKIKQFKTAKEIAEYLNANLDLVRDTLDDLIVKGQVFPVSHTFLGMEEVNRSLVEMEQVLENYHKKYRLRQGMSLEEFRSKFGQFKGKELEAMLKYLKEEQLVQVTGSLIKLTDFEVSYNSYQLKEKERIEKVLKQSGLTPPSVEEILADSPNAKEVLEALNGVSIYYLNPETIIHMDTFNHGVNFVKQHITENGSLTLGEFRDEMDTSRKYAMMFLEHLDELGITKRVENNRVLA